MEYLRFWVTRDGVIPLNKNIEAIKNMKPPSTREESIKFIGLVKYYHNIPERHSHTLDPLTSLVYSKEKFK